MEEIISLSGKSVKIWYETLNERPNAIDYAQRMMSGRTKPLNSEKLNGTGY